MSNIAVSLIGASSRAAACSAWRAGWQARACDLFGDLDLRQRAEYEPLPGPYPSALAEFVRRGPDVPWMYTGGLENHPELVEEMARSRPVWGNTGATLRAVRDPFVLGETLREGGFDFPESSLTSHRGGGRYLLKPLRSSGGGRIRFAPESSSSTPAPNGHFYQRFRSGAACSVIYIGEGGAAGSATRTLGVTRQLVGESWLHAPPFAWCGNVGPIRLNASDEDLLDRLGLYLVARFRLAGIFGVDLVISDEGIQIIEVNPRYPASLEVLELAIGKAALPLHRAAFESTKAETWPATKALTGEVVGKAVYRAPRRLVVTEDLLSCAATSPFDVPVAADLPPRGTEIEQGQPVLTVYGRGRTEEECSRELRDAARGFEERLLATR